MISVKTFFDWLESAEPESDGEEEKDSVRVEPR